MAALKWLDMVAPFGSWVGHLGRQHPPGSGAGLAIASGSRFGRRVAPVEVPGRCPGPVQAAHLRAYPAPKTRTGHVTVCRAVGRGKRPARWCADHHRCCLWQPHRREDR